ncbi:hypothetical protein JCM33374_g2476 [Metschnikowia sp. JCM 33374]|nr:hypothetical protein JCM33374_g2476 [Metschnikowia sp. JCM 33374]
MRQVQEITFFSGLSDQFDLINRVSPPIVSALKSFSSGIERQFSTLVEEIKSVRSEVENLNSILSEFKETQRQIKATWREVKVTQGQIQEFWIMIENHQAAVDNLYQAEGQKFEALCNSIRSQPVDLEANPSMLALSTDESSAAKNDDEKYVEEINSIKPLQQVVAGPPLSLEPQIPAFRMKANNTVPQLIEEWYGNEKGKMNIEQMDQKYGPLWRKNKASFYKRRKAVINFINRELENSNDSRLTREILGQLLDIYRIARYLRLNALCERLQSTTEAAKVSEAVNRMWQERVRRMDQQ